MRKTRILRQKGLRLRSAIIPIERYLNVVRPQFHGGIEGRLLPFADGPGRWVLAMGCWLLTTRHWILPFAALQAQSHFSPLISASGPIPLLLGLVWCNFPVPELFLP